LRATSPQEKAADEHLPGLSHSRVTDDEELEEVVVLSVGLVTGGRDDNSVATSTASRFRVSASHDEEREREERERERKRHLCVDRGVPSVPESVNTGRERERERNQAVQVLRKRCVCGCVA
jgi:hypothetical protein